MTDASITSVKASTNILKSFFELSKDGICSVDLEGINSPKRAFNKLGYGGEINPYYHLRKT